MAADDIDIHVDRCSRLLFDPSPRIITAHARYAQRTRVCVEPGGRGVVVDAVVLHPDLDGAVFGSYESSVTVSAPDGVLLAADTQVLPAMPRVRRCPGAFATVFVLGADLSALSPELEALGYIGVSDLPNDAGAMVRIAAADGGLLRAALASVTALVDAA